MYLGAKDVDRLSKDLSFKDLEKLIRCFTSLSKKHEIPSSCRVEAYSASHALPEVSVSFGLSSPFLSVAVVFYRVLNFFSLLCALQDHQILSFLPHSLKVER
jgi:hypothetical protein